MVLTANSQNHYLCIGLIAHLFQLFPETGAGGNQGRLRLCACDQSFNTDLSTIAWFNFGSLAP